MAIEDSSLEHQYIRACSALVSIEEERIAAMSKVNDYRNALLSAARRFELLAQKGDVPEASPTVGLKEIRAVLGITSRAVD